VVFPVPQRLLCFRELRSHHKSSEHNESIYFIVRHITDRVTAPGGDFLPIVLGTTLIGGRELLGAFDS
jgi:hypothetical protein